MSSAEVAQTQNNAQSNTSIEDDHKNLVVGNYRLDKIIGQGTYGKVRLGYHINTLEKVAIKVIEKIQIQSAKQVARLQREIRFLKLLHHPHIVRVQDVIETNDFIYIVMEYACGGELFDYIVAQKRVKEKEARSFFRMVLSAVDYCHQNAVIHRDLKPENLLLDDKKCIKIIDFGFGNNFTLNGLLDTFCGSPFYAAPEMILGKKYEGPEVDMWSLGVILFALLCGHLPFDDDNMKELYKKIASGSYRCPDYLLPNAKHLISRLITVDPKRRATLDEVLKHPWVNEGYDSPPPSYIPIRPTITDPSKLSKDIINRLQIFGYKLEDIRNAFSPEQDTKPHPIRATYFLLTEMVVREQARMRNEKKRIAEAASKAKSMSNSSIGTLVTAVNDDDVVKSRGSISKGFDNNSEHQLSEKYESDNDKYIKEKHVSVSRRTTASEIQFVSSKPKESSVDVFLGSPSTSEKNGPMLVSNKPTVRKDGLPPLPDKYQSATDNSIATPPPSACPNRTIRELPRRSTVPSNMVHPYLASTSPKTSVSSKTASTAADKIKEELRAVSGWFLNVSATSSKSPEEIIQQVINVLNENNVTWRMENESTFHCDVDVYDLISSKAEPDDFQSKSVDDQPRFSTVAQYSRSSEAKNRGDSTTEPATPKAAVKRGPSKAKPGFVSFQIEICNVPKSAMHGVHFKRLQGGVWNYKKSCNKLISQMKL